jgi:hypothetical protein
MNSENTLLGVSPTNHKLPPLKPPSVYSTVKPSLLRHTLCASISTLQNSSPRPTTQASRTFFVSGQEQHIFLQGRKPLKKGRGGELDGKKKEGTGVCVFIQGARERTCRSFQALVGLHQQQARLQLHWEGHWMT